MRPIEAQLLDEIRRVMAEKGVNQADFARHKKLGRQAVNPYFRGNKSLLTETGKDLLEFLGVRIRLEPISSPKRGRVDEQKGER